MTVTTWNEDSWNTCPRCRNSVDADDVHDGSEVYCHGCDIPLVCVNFTDETWALTEYDNEDDVLESEYDS